MNFKSLKDLTPRQLVMYWLIGILIGYLLSLAQVIDQVFIGPVLATFGGGIQILGWISLVYAGIKWVKNKSKKTENQK